jgi:hypothetical protein
MSGADGNFVVKTGGLSMVPIVSPLTFIPLPLLLASQERWTNNQK